MKAFLEMARIIVAASAIAVVGCGVGDANEAIEGVSSSLAANAAASPAAAVSPVLVRVEEFTVTPARSSVPAGAVRFMVLNLGTEFHEFVVVKTDLAIDQLPVNEDGSFDEEGEGVEVIDEIEMVEPGTMERLTVSLEAGHYVILCNRIEIEEDGEIESHFMEGMSADFTVL